MKGYNHPVTVAISRPPHGGRGLKFIFIPPIEALAPCRPPHGGRGLKLLFVNLLVGIVSSPSPRRAWIEMLYRVKKVAFISVALPTEGVD